MMTVLITHLIKSLKISAECFCARAYARSTFREEREVLLRKCRGSIVRGFPPEACGNDSVSGSMLEAARIARHAGTQRTRSEEVI